MNRLQPDQVPTAIAELGLGSGTKYVTCQGANPLDRETDANYYRFDQHQSMLERYNVDMSPELTLRDHIHLVFGPSQAGKDHIVDQVDDLGQVRVGKGKPVFNATVIHQWTTRRPRYPAEPKVNRELTFVYPEYGEIEFNKAHERLLRQESQDHLYIERYSGNYYGLELEHLKESLASPKPVIFYCCGLEMALSFMLACPTATSHLLLPESFVTNLAEKAKGPRPGQETEDYHWRYLQSVAALCYALQCAKQGTPLFDFIHLVEHIPDERAVGRAIDVEAQRIAMDCIALFKKEAMFLNQQRTDRARRWLNQRQATLTDYRKNRWPDPAVTADPLYDPRRWTAEPGLEIARYWEARNMAYIGPLGVVPSNRPLE